MNIINKGVSIEINKLSYDDIAMLATWAFNKAMGSHYSDEYWVGNSIPNQKKLFYQVEYAWCLLYDHLQN